MSVKEHYTIMKWLARSYFDESTPLSEGPVVLPDMPKDAVWRGRFRGSREGVPYEFSLTTVDLGYWGARVATADPEADHGEAEQRLDALREAERRVGKEGVSTCSAWGDAVTAKINKKI